MDAFHAEVVAALAGVSVVAGMGLTRVALETDSMLLVQALKGGDFRLAATGVLIHELKSLASSSFGSFDVLFCPRTYNKLAHAIAELGRMYPLEADLSWDGPSLEVEEIVADDLAAASV